MHFIYDLVASIRNGNNPVVEFATNIEELDVYAEPGMRARAIAARIDADGLAAITFRYTEFERHNAPLERPTYYDKDGNPTLTAHQANAYHPEEDIYFDVEELMAVHLNVVSDERTALYAQYLGEASKDTYLRWLEDKVLAAAAQ